MDLDSALGILAQEPRISRPPAPFTYDWDQAQRSIEWLANYAILSQADNAELTGRDPFDVWRSLKPNQREWASTQLFFIAREDLLKAYDEFIEFRAEKLADALNDFVGLGERRAGGQAAAAAVSRSGTALGT